MIRPRYSPATHVYVAAPIWSGVRESNPAVLLGRQMLYQLSYYCII